MEETPFVENGWWWNQIWKHPRVEQRCMRHPLADPVSSAIYRKKVQGSFFCTISLL